MLVVAHRFSAIKRAHRILVLDQGRIVELYVQRIGGLIFVSVYAIIIVAAIFRLDWRFGLISLLLGMVTTRISARFMAPVRRLSDAIQSGLGCLTERLLDLLQGARVAKLFQIEAIIHQEYTAENNAVVALQLQRARLDTILGTTDFVLGHFKSVGLLALGLFLLLRGYPIQVGTIAAILYLQGIADYIFRDFGNVLTDLQKSLAGAHRVLEVLDTATEPTTYGEGTQAVDKYAAASPDPAMVALNNLTFAYVAEEKIGNRERVTALRNVSFRVAPDQLVAFVGPSGGGKSTLFKLLLGFYPIAAGALTIDGQPSEHYSLSAWRDQIAYVPQDAYLFTGTIADIFAMANPRPLRQR